MNLGIENEMQEFKEGLGQLDKGLKSLTAMLNRNGTGTVYYGVDDNGNVKGISVGKKTLLDIRNRIKDIIEPQILAEIKDLVDESDRHYISVSALGTDTPYSCDGRYYIRNVSADESVSNEMLRKMLVSGDADLIRKIPSEVQNLTFVQLLTILAERKIHTNDTEEFYRNYGLINHEGKYSYMAYLLSDQNEVSLKVVRFAGTDKSVMSERTEFGKKCLILSVYQVLEYFKSLNITRVSLENGVREENPVFIFEAFREAWINACLHNSWCEKIPPSVYVFDDRIEIVSNGGIPYGLSEEGFYNGTSRPINKSLLTLFIIAGLAEQSGHGIPIIVSSYGREAFDMHDGIMSVHIGFQYEPENVSQRKQLERSAVHLSSKQKAILEFLKKNPQATLKEVSGEVGLSLSGVKKNVSKLQELEILYREGSKRIGIWKSRL